MSYRLPPSGQLPWNPLPFERRFREWVKTRGIRWARCDFELEGAVPTRAFRFTPGRANRRVVAFHGAGNDALFGWIGLFRRLLEDGAEVYTFDLPGHGREASTLLDGREIVQDLGRALDVAEEGQPPLPLHAVGVSLGGSLLLAALPAVQERLASAALVVAPTRIVLSGRSVFNELRPSILSLLWRERRDYGLTGLIPSFASFKREVYPIRLRDGVAPGAFGYVDRLNEMLEECELGVCAAETRIPTLLAYGSRDRIVPPEQGRRLADHLPDGDFVEVEGGAHLTTPLDPAVLDRITAWTRHEST